MKRIVSFFGAGALVLACAGCAANPIDGDWTASMSVGGFPFTMGLHFLANGTASTTISGDGSLCTGTVTLDGYAWSSTDTTLTIAGAGTCSGAITCGLGGSSQTVDCSALHSSSTNDSTTCTYALSSNNDTLALTACSGGSSNLPETWARAPQD